jgi:CrcB protein
MMMNVLMVAAGGALGATARYATGLVATRLFGHGFPWGTMIVNVLGSFLMGVLIGWLLARAAGDQLVRLFLATGVLGGFTTFSAFSLDAVTLWERGETGAAAAYVTASVGLSLAALFAGLWMIRAGH